MNIFPRDQVQKIEASRSKSKNPRLKWGFLQNGKSMDFEIGFEFFRRITLDRFQSTPATFLPKKNQSKRPPNQISRIEQKRHLERRKRKKGGGDEIRNRSQHK
jgi:hypothetical protein